MIKKIWAAILTETSSLVSCSVGQTIFIVDKLKLLRWDRSFSIQRGKVDTLLKLSESNVSCKPDSFKMRMIAHV